MSSGICWSIVPIFTSNALASASRYGFKIGSAPGSGVIMSFVHAPAALHVYVASGHGTVGQWHAPVPPSCGAPPSTQLFPKNAVYKPVGSTRSAFAVVTFVPSKWMF